MESIHPQVAAASADEARTKRVVVRALADMRHEMDIRDEDGAPDRNAWIDLEREAIKLMLRAYYRNHNAAVV